jgi:hypothetical protein
MCLWSDAVHRSSAKWELDHRSESEPQTRASNWYPACCCKPATTNSFCSPFLSSTQMLCSPNLLLKPRALQSFLLQFVSLAGSQPRSVCYTGTSLPVPATTATATAAPGCTVTAPSPTAPSAVSPRCTVHIFTAFFFTFPWSCIFLKFLTP